MVVLFQLHVKTLTSWETPTVWVTMSLRRQHIAREALCDYIPHIL